MPQNQGVFQFSAPPTRPIADDAFAASDRTSLWWLTGAGFLINVRGTLLMIDPVITMKTGSGDFCELGHRMLVPLPITADRVPRLDAVLYTHIDDDHLAPLTAPALAHAGGLYGGPAIAVRELVRLGIPEERTRALSIGETFRVGQAEITLTRADHSWQEQDPAKFGTPYGPEDCCGFLIRTPDGVIWHTGDSRLLPEHLQMNGVDVLLLDVSNDPYHFGAEAAVMLANHYADADLIAHHYGTYDAPEALPFNGDPSKLAPRIDGSADRLHILAPGERFTLNGGGSK
ncbi:MBL fold metallo-hydrolase [Paenibacillus humicola]|uniref:MBL fold metallo-hydrolase n=1 Tax=Paenibacillus humicola TaxID=3110540 RepID=UPI00237A9577|nr:MBL fold metallo-hydrolase [Paenibacillus humicola]